MLSRIAETIRRHRMFEPGQHVGVAVSGGADSVCLLHVLLELARWDLRVSVLHLNHGLRGEESLADEQFVRELAARLGLPASVRAVDLSASADNLEQAARHARLAFFREQLSSGDMARIATGHTSNDQAETVLFRFLRGSGGAGLAAIRPVTTEGIVRPAARTRAESRSNNTCASVTSRGARIRPMPARNSPVIGSATSCCHNWPANGIRRSPRRSIAPPIGRWPKRSTGRRKSSRLPAPFADRALGRAVFARAGICQLPLAAARRLVRRALEGRKRRPSGQTSITSRRCPNWPRSARGTGRVQAPGCRDRAVARLASFCRFRRRPPAWGVSPGCEHPGSSVRLPGTGIVISLELIEKAETLEPLNSVYNGETGCLDWRVLSGSLEIRNWRPGDRYQPKGSAGEEKIKILFQKARIPRWERRLLAGCHGRIRNCVGRTVRRGNALCRQPRMYHGTADSGGIAA